MYGAVKYTPFAALPAISRTGLAENEVSPMTGLLNPAFRNCFMIGPASLDSTTTKTTSAPDWTIFAH